MWAAVRYAHQVASADDHCDKNVWDAGVIGKYIIDWLVCHSEGDLSVLLKFDAQVDALKVALREMGQENRLVPYIDTYQICPWLVTQGEAIFTAVLSMPPLLGVLQCISKTYCCFEKDLASNAMYSFLESTRWDDHDALHWFSNRTAQGVHIEDFEGWDVSRLLAALDETERNSEC